MHKATVKKQGGCAPTSWFYQPVKILLRDANRIHLFYKNECKITYANPMDFLDSPKVNGI